MKGGNLAIRSKMNILELKEISTSREQKTVRGLFQTLINAPVRKFPSVRGNLDAPREHGVYVIYGPRMRVLHVGRTLRGIRGGVRNRLGNHLHGASSFSQQYLDGEVTKLRRHCAYRCLVVNDPRLRALLEAFAIGYLCPAHIGTGDKVAMFLPPQGVHPFGVSEGRRTRAIT